MDQSERSCCPPVTRRTFLGGVAVTTLASSRIMAGPFEAEQLARLIPADKKLAPDWVQALTARGEPTVYRGAELDLIGQPVGGIGCGQVYLGGDGRLWHWDIFNQHVQTGAAHYVQPLRPDQGVLQGFALRLAGDQVRTLDRDGFGEVSFRGEYPVGTVEYRDPACPVTATLTAWSPFVPLDTAASSLPATVLQITLRNTGAAAVEVELAGWLENAVCRHSATQTTGQRRSRVRRAAAALLLEHAAEPLPEAAPERPDVVFADFEQDHWEGWTVTGTAFGTGPLERSRIPGYQGHVGGEGQRVVNSHNVRQGEDVSSGDQHTGRLTSREFTIERRFISFYLGGGAHAGRTCLNLLVEGQVVRTAVGRNANQMVRESWNVTDLAGRRARLELVDEETGPWGNIGLDHVVFSDRPLLTGPLDQQADWGTMALALVGPTAGDSGRANLPAGRLAAEVFPAPPADEAVAPFGHRLAGALLRRVTLAPGATATADFVVAWHFPNHRLGPVRGSQGRFYTTRFASAGAVAEHLAAELPRLAAETLRWRDTWYDSTLPWWLLDRTFANTSTLATSTCHRFTDGRFYGWEGVGCCGGTCTHVWHYAQAPARLFPDLERDLRERTDYGLAFDRASGVIRFRGEGAGLAIDGQAGCVLRTWREHLMSESDAFLRRCWDAVKLALDCLIREDGNGDGLLEGAQHNTLDTEWYGPVSWLSSLYLAALAAGEAMAAELGDTAYAAKVRPILERGRRLVVERLFNGEYFLSRPDAAHPEAVNAGAGCHIDQVLGQAWAWQVGLPRVLPERETVSALRALWRHNFALDVGPYREANKPGRWYAVAGEAGLLMCTFPDPAWGYEQARGQGQAAGFAGYFNECMTGFEHAAAAHLIAEGLVQEGLAVVRAIHDRYHASRRNPYNEVECGDHYARAMASYGVHLAVCGWSCHGPQGRYAWRPRLTPEDFRAAFTAPAGWGTITQTRAAGTQTNAMAVRWGNVRVRSLGFDLAAGHQPREVVVTLGDRTVASRFAMAEGAVTVTLADDLVVPAGQTMRVVMR